MVDKMKYKISLKQYYNEKGDVDSQYFVIKKLIYKIFKLEFWTTISYNTYSGRTDLSFNTLADAENYIAEVLLKGIPRSKWKITDIKEIYYNK